MTEQPERDKPRSELGFKLFKGRRLGPLIGPWVSSAVFAALVFYVQRTVPALQEVGRLVYFLLAVIVVITTGRWLRVRGSDRRAADRRQPRRET